MSRQSFFGATEWAIIKCDYQQQFLIGLQLQGMKPGSHLEQGLLGLHRLQFNSGGQALLWQSAVALPTMTL
jgi:hypothetical protein